MKILFWVLLLLVTGTFYSIHAQEISIVTENYPPYPLEDVFKYQYETMPDDLTDQMREHKKFLKWREEQKN